MPFVRVSMIEGKNKDYKGKVAETIYQSLRETFDVPERDKFIVIHEHSKDNFIYDENYLDLKKTDDLIIIQIFANNTRTTEQKQSLFLSVTENLYQEVGIGKENLLIGIVEVGKENWSFGNGIAQYA
ncbi:tautomerase family protein [Sporolactobacillus laevolacticus]|uniref:tautomerase family protein n=1 Tax=Sporolactobacillus laevolacticus TaxID=33018 RepID=UPI0025B55EF2|nr:tautomerase family protein [Sporolactobacillus laevolacticus]MDN3954449.1 tautomerase family protein [Sporolactobacillus laevolacticus]